VVSEFEEDGGIFQRFQSSKLCYELAAWWG